MTTATVAARLVKEGNAQTSNVPIDNRKSHAGHGCCRDGSIVVKGDRVAVAGGRALVGVASDGSRRSLTFTLRCRSVNRCVCCRKVKRNQDRARAFMGAAERGKVAMVTLTIARRDPRFLDGRNRSGKARPLVAEMLPERLGGTLPTDRLARDVYAVRASATVESLRYQSWAWNRLRANLTNRKRLGRLAYYRGVELHKDGVAHVHVLIRVQDAAAFLALRAALRGDEATRGTYALKDKRNGLAILAGFGKVVDVQLARSKGDVARYVSKMEDAGQGDRLATETRGAIATDSRASAYATKGTSAAMPRYTRRTAYSRGSKRLDPWAGAWVKPTPIAGFVWRLAGCSEEVAQAALLRSDFVLDDPARYRVAASAGRPAEGF